MESSEPEITVCYFGVLRDAVGVAEESLRTEAPTPRALYDEVCALHDIGFPVEEVIAVVNDTYCMWHVGLDDGDKVVFVPRDAAG